MSMAIPITSEDRQRFLTASNQLKNDLGITNDDTWFDLNVSLIDRYEESHRHYHNLGHIVEGMELIERTAPNFFLAKLAYLFHDVIYVAGVHGDHNEVASAEYARKALSSLVDADTAQIVYDMICATSDHMIPQHFSGNRDELALMLDVDLAGLGSDPTVFAMNTANIVAEQGQIEATKLAAGLAAFAGKMLGRERIYHSHSFAHLEQQAKVNLTNLEKGL